MRIYIRVEEAIYETTAYNPFMYKDEMYCSIKRKKRNLIKNNRYKYQIVHVLTGQGIIICISKDIEDNIKRLRETEKVYNKTVAAALTERFKDNQTVNINTDQWNKLITRLKK